MAQVSFTVGLPAELELAVREAAQGAGVSRNRWVRRALEAALDGGAVADGQRSAVLPADGSAASPRTSRASAFREATQ